MTIDRFRLSALNGRQWIAPAAMLVGSVLSVATLLFKSNFSDAVEEPRAVIEQRRSTLRFVPSAADPSDTAKSPQPPISTEPTDERSFAELRAGLQAIATEERELTSTGMERERQSALLRLRMYRFLCYLPQDDLTLSRELDEDALAVADICRRLKKLSHAPDNPGLPDAEYERARVAAGKCNLSSGQSSLSKAIDLWMNDSDAQNFNRLGHRRWCLNPKLLKLGLGRSEQYCAMWAFDSSRTPAPEYAFISFPPPGFVPVDFFASSYAWSVSLNPGKYRPPDLKAITVELFPIRQDQVDRDRPFEIERLTVDTQGFGVNNCVIFRPKSLKVLPLQSYQLEIRGLQYLDGEPTRVSFSVRFVDAISLVISE